MPNILIISLVSRSNMLARFSVQDCKSFCEIIEWSSIGKAENPRICILGTRWKYTVIVIDRCFEVVQGGVGGRKPVAKVVDDCQEKPRS